MRVLTAIPSTTPRRLGASHSLSLFPPLPDFFYTLRSSSQADKICTHNRRYAEYSGYWLTTDFLEDQKGRETTFYDAVTGSPLFVAPRVRARLIVYELSYIYVIRRLGSTVLYSCFVSCLLTSWMPPLKAKTHCTYLPNPARRVYSTYCIV